MIILNAFSCFFSAVLFVILLIISFIIKCSCVLHGADEELIVWCRLIMLNEHFDGPISNEISVASLCYDNSSLHEYEQHNNSRRYGVVFFILQHFASLNLIVWAENLLQVRFCLASRQLLLVQMVFFSIGDKKILILVAGKV